MTARISRLAAESIDMFREKNNCDDSFQRTELVFFFVLKLKNHAKRCVTNIAKKKFPAAVKVLVHLLSGHASCYNT